MCPAKTQISLGRSAWRKLGSLATHWAHSEDSDQTGWMPRLIWVHSHIVGFVMSRLIFRQPYLGNQCRQRSDCSFSSGLDSSSSSLMRAYTVCHSICIFWMHYFMVKLHCSNFKIIIAIFSECFIFFMIPPFHLCSMGPKDADGMANRSCKSSLICFYTVWTVQTCLS